MIACVGEVVCLAACVVDFAVFCMLPFVLSIECRCSCLLLQVKQLWTGGRGRLVSTICKLDNMLVLRQNKLREVQPREFAKIIGNGQSLPLVGSVMMVAMSKLLYAGHSCNKDSLDDSRSCINTQKMKYPLS